MAGLFGGALIALASALLALALSRDHERLLACAPIVILGTCVFGFVAFAKVTAFGFPTLGHWMMVALIAPAGFLTIGFARRVATYKRLDLLLRESLSGALP